MTKTLYSDKEMRWGLMIFGDEHAGDKISAANRLIGEVVQSQRRPLLGPSPG